MRLWVKMTLVFVAAQIVVTATIWTSITAVVRSRMETMVEAESRHMIAAIADAAVMAVRGAGGGEAAEGSGVPPQIRSYVLDRRIGESGFYFLLGEDGTYLVHPNGEVQGQNWAGEQPFIDYILSNRDAGPEERFVRYVSPETGAWKQVYFAPIAGTEWTICSSAWEDDVYAPIGSITMVVALVLVVSLALVIALSVAVSRRIGGTLSALTMALAKVGSGDLTASVEPDAFSVETNDAAHALNDAVIGMMRTAVGAIQKSALDSSAIKDELSSATIETSSALNQITANLGSIGAHITHLDRTIDTNVEAVNTINTRIQEVDSRITEQTAMVEQSRAAIEEMNTAVGSVASTAATQRDATEELSDASRRAASALEKAHAAFSEGVVAKIGAINEVAEAIQDIAARTNLLAMNAAIEAAHAGETGKGFAVVASEIRTLASSAAQSSGAISQMIQQVVANIEVTKSAIDRAALDFAHVVEETDGTVSALRAIENRISQLSTGGSEILRATTHLQETTLAIQENSGTIRGQATVIAEAESQIKRVSAENAAGLAEMTQGIEEINRAMHALTELSERVAHVIGDLEAEVAVFTMEVTTLNGD